MAPLVLLLVAGVLFLYRKIYAEVGSALPLNGGTYTVLLNTTNKRTAAVAACLTLLSYIATAVISANEAMHYAAGLLPTFDIVLATVWVLGVFAVLGIVGIGESAKVALVIFVIHMVTLVALSGAAIFALVRDPTLLLQNLRMPPPQSIPHALFFGFAVAMLGISGFESSANFIEEQKKGVFPKTLRNMWIAVAVFNPLIAFLALGLLPLDQIQAVPQDLLAQMGARAAGPSLANLVSVDAVLVLSGAVLTSFVGVTGLVRRMALDRCLPAFLLQRNRWRGTHHWIPVAFFLLCTSILLVTKGRIQALAGVYTLAFLSVMALFAIGNMLLKSKRAGLPRSTHASWPTVVTALVAVLVGLVGNVLLDPITVGVFQVYFLATLALVGLMFLRLRILKAALHISEAVFRALRIKNDGLSQVLRRAIERINGLAMVFFTKGDDMVALNRAALYVMENEQTSRLKVVHVFNKAKGIPADLGEHLRVVDHLYPQLRIDFLAVEGEFRPESVEALSRRLGIPKNQMFIGTPSGRFPHQLEELGGVRVII